MPPDPNQIHRTGTGRTAALTIRPRSLQESGESNGSVSLSGLSDGPLDIQGEPDAGPEDTAFSLCRGGWPGAMNQEQSIALEQAFDSRDAVVRPDTSRAGHASREEQRARRLPASCARDAGSQASIRSIRDDRRSDDADTLTEDTASSCLDALRKIFAIGDAPAWNPNLRSRTAVRTSGTRYFTDPSIAAAALGAGPEDLRNDLNTMGRFFENLCTRDLRVYADALDGAISRCRGRNGLECDAVLHRRNGSCGPLEIRLGGEKAIEDGAASQEKRSDRLDTTKMKKPAFRMVPTADGKYACRRGDGILAVPVSGLHPQPACSRTAEQIIRRERPQNSRIQYGKGEESAAVQQIPPPVPLRQCTRRAGDLPREPAPSRSFRSPEAFPPPGSVISGSAVIIIPCSPQSLCCPPSPKPP